MLNSVIQQGLYLGAFGLILGGLVFFHELGHFLGALWCKIKVREFAVGIPPRVLGTAVDKNGKRRWFGMKVPPEVDPEALILSLNLFPIGGFVRPAGEDDPTVPDGLSAAPKLSRFIVLAAGPAANLLIGILVFTIGYSTGWPDYRIKISEIVPDAPAAQAGIMVGDIVLSVNGEDLTGAKAYSDRLAQAVRSNAGKPITLMVQRGEKNITLTMTPRTPDQTPSGQGPIGVVLGMAGGLKTYTLPYALWYGTTEVWTQTQEMFLLPVRIIVGSLNPSEVRFVSVVGMKTVSDAVVETAVEIQSWYPILKFIGTISVALALTNLLPLPALDGGRILFVLIEAVRRKRIAPEREGLVHLIGLAALFTLMLIMVINDFINPLITK